MGSPVDVWTPADIPDQAGRTVVVTGPTLGGLGHHTALELARRGARVVLAGRTPSKVEATRDALLAELTGLPADHVETLAVDLASLTSVRRAAAQAAALGPIDVLVNNAGVMATRPQRTDDGLDLQLATNHFGPFLLTGLLLPQLAASDTGRVVAVSSIFHRFARRAPLREPTRARRPYGRWRTYAGTKLANLLFTYELDRRCRDAGVPVKALAAHPGFAGTHLAANGQYGRSSGGIASVLDAGIRTVAQPVWQGAWPTLMAATADLPGGTYCGPSGLGELEGTPQVTTSTRLSRDAGAAVNLWELSERITGVTYP